MQDEIVIVITFYSPSCLGQETAKGPFGLRVKLRPAHLSTTHDGHKISRPMVIKFIRFRGRAVYVNFK